MDEDENALNKVLNIVDANGFINIVSTPMLNSRFNAAITVEIHPDNSEWDFGVLSVFVNQLQDYKLDPSNGCRCQFNTNNEHYFFLNL